MVISGYFDSKFLSLQGFPTFSLQSPLASVQRIKNTIIIWVRISSWTGQQGHTTTPLTLHSVTTAGSFQMIIVKCKKVVNVYTQVQSVNILELILSKSTKQYQVWNHLHLILACGSNCLKMGAVFIKILLIKRNYADAVNTQFFFKLILWKKYLA